MATIKKDKLDYKKEYKDLYLPKQEPMIIDVPRMNFIAIDGIGEPGGPAYQEAISILYALSFTIKMSKMSGVQPDGYFEYVVPPLEGLWWYKDRVFDYEEFKDNRSEWEWTSLIRQPEFVAEDVFNWSLNECSKKRPDLPLNKARFLVWEEGLCVQAMHIGPYSDEPATIERLEAFIKENNLKNDTGIIRKHHEIYLGDPRKTKPENLKTVLRLPVSSI